VIEVSARPRKFHINPKPKPKTTKPKPKTTKPNHKTSKPNHKAALPKSHPKTLKILHTLMSKIDVPKKFNLTTKGLTKKIKKIQTKSSKLKELHQKHGPIYFTTTLGAQFRKSKTKKYSTLAH
jgi:hypothetical protein